MEKFAELLFRTWLTLRIGPQNIAWSELPPEIRAAWMSIADTAIKLAPTVERKLATR